MSVLSLENIRINITGAYRVFLKYIKYNTYVFYGPKQRENLHTNTCPRTLGFFSMTTLDMNTHENNSYFGHQYQWS